MKFRCGEVPGRLTSFLERSGSGKISFSKYCFSITDQMILARRFSLDCCSWSSDWRRRRLLPYLDLLLNSRSLLRSSPDPTLRGMLLSLFAALGAVPFILVSSAGAATCTPVLKARNLPIYDQGQTNTCYAFAATQVFDAWRQGHGAKTPPLSSAPEAAFRYTMKEMDPKWEDVQSGDPSRTLRMLVSDGACPYVSAHDFSQDQLGSRWEQYERLAKARRDYHHQEERMERGNKRSGWLSSKTPRQKHEQILSQVACDVVDPRLDGGQISTWSQFVEKAIDTRDTITFMKTVFAAWCEGGGKLMPPGSPRTGQFLIDSGANVKTMAPTLQSKVDSALDRGGGKIPLISYCPNVMTHPGSREIRWSSKKNQFQ